MCHEDTSVISNLTESSLVSIGAHIAIHCQSILVAGTVQHGMDVEKDKWPAFSGSHRRYKSG